MLILQCSLTISVHSRSSAVELIVTVTIEGNRLLRPPQNGLAQQSDLYQLPAIL